MSIEEASPDDSQAKEDVAKPRADSLSESGSSQQSGAFVLPKGIGTVPPTPSNSQNAMSLTTSLTSPKIVADKVDFRKIFSPAPHRRRMSTGSIADTIDKRINRSINAIDVLTAKIYKGQAQRDAAVINRRVGVDITGLRKALSLRIYGVETLSVSGDGRKSPSAAWLRRRRGSAGDENPRIIIWVLDIESGVEWKVKKTLSDFVKLHEECECLGPTPSSLDFPFKKSKTPDNASISTDKQTRLEKYLRKLAGLTSVSPVAGAFSVAKAVQDFLGVPERIDQIAVMEQRPERGLRQSIQVYAYTIIGMPVFDNLIRDFVEKVKSGDVLQIDFLKEISRFIDHVAECVMGGCVETLRLLVLSKNPNLALDEVDNFCLSCVRRQVEAEIYVPCLEKINEYIQMVVKRDHPGEEAELRQKMKSFQMRPQTFFGIHVSQISVSSWESGVEKLKVIGSETTLPSDKVDALVAAVKEIHSLYRKEHPGSSALGADDFLPIFLYAVAHSNVMDLVSIKVLMAGMCDSRLLMSEAGYCIATLEAAIGYLSKLDENADV